MPIRRVIATNNVFLVALRYAVSLVIPRYLAILVMSLCHAHSVHSVHLEHHVHLVALRCTTFTSLHTLSTLSCTQK